MTAVTSKTPFPKFDYISNQPGPQAVEFLKSDRIKSMAFRHFNQRVLKTPFRPKLEESSQILPRAKREETATNSL